MGRMAAVVREWGHRRRVRPPPPAPPRVRADFDADDAGADGFAADPVALAEARLRRLDARLRWLEEDRALEQERYRGDG